MTSLPPPPDPHHRSSGPLDWLATTFGIAVVGWNLLWLFVGGAFLVTGAVMLVGFLLGYPDTLPGAIAGLVIGWLVIPKPRRR